jgi:hypothetical protein
MNEIASLGNNFLKYFQTVTEYEANFNSGVPKSYINEVLGLLEKELPSDFFLLYEWHNGYSEFRGHSAFNLQDYAPFHFNSIEMIDFERKWEWCDDSPPKYEGHNILPFVSGDSLFWGIALNQDYSMPHIVYVDGTGETIIRYDSITTMMRTLVESFSVNALFFDKGRIVKNNQLFSQAAKQQNPKTWYKAIRRFDENILTYGLDEHDSETYSLQCSFLWNTLQTLKYMQTDEIIVKCRNKLAQLENLSSQRAIDAYTSLNRWLNTDEAYD